MERELIGPEELESRFKSKKTLYNILKVDCKFSIYNSVLSVELNLPSYKSCPLHFIRQLLAGEKLALKTDEVTLLAAPKYSELSVEKICRKVAEIPELKQYFPDLDDGQLPERDFLFSILSTLRRDELKNLIHEARGVRAIANKSNDDDMIAVLPCIKDEMFKILPTKNPSGRVYQLLKQGAKLKKTKAAPHKYNARLSVLKYGIIGGDGEEFEIDDEHTDAKNVTDHINEETKE